MNTIHSAAIAALLCLLAFSAKTQTNTIVSIPGKVISKINTRAEEYNKKIDRKTEKYLRRLEKEEAKLTKKLMALDSNAARELLSSAANQYQSIMAKVKNKTATLTTGKITEYIPNFDSTLTSLKFLGEHSHFLKDAEGVKKKLDAAIQQFQLLQQKIKTTNDLKEFIRERKQYLNNVLSRYKLEKHLKGYNKQAYYYAVQLAEYKEVLRNPEKAEQLIVRVLSKIPEFKSFFSGNGLLSGMFSGSSTPTQPPDLTGLQARNQVQQYLVQQTGGAISTQFTQQNIQNAQTQLNALRSRLPQLSNTGSELAMPDFRVNQQKTKPFGKRLEWGVSLNTQKGRNAFPNTGDLALTVGYKLNSQFVTGIGLNTKTGFGSGWNKVKLSYEGIGGRSYIDWKIPKSGFWLTGGYELSYFSRFSKIEELKRLNRWQHSCLFGLTKKIQLKNKGVKLQLLWNILADKYIPGSPKLLYRIIFIK